MKKKGMKYMEARVHPEYERQQGLLDAAANRFGVFAFRPDYHAEVGDKNTVLFYTAEDELFNRSLDKKEKQGEFVSSDMYRKPFWTFENSDANGAGNYGFANFGMINLRTNNTRFVIYSAVGVALVRKIQTEHIQRTGGYLALREADDVYNNLNRRIIKYMLQAKRPVYLGNVNFYGEDRERVINGGSIFREHTGEGEVYNFDCSFVVPEMDEELQQMVVAWNKDTKLPASAALVSKITNRVEKIGGENLIWF